jgi:hypothetical protein
MTGSTRVKWVALPWVGALLTGVALAEDPAPAPARVEASAAVAVSATADIKVSAEGFLLSLRLPTLAHETREKGVPNDDVKVALASLREANVPPEEAIATFEATVASIDEKGPVENFGELVQSKVKDGLRGAQLAKAIRDEHEQRGIGKGKKLTRDGEHPGKHLGQDPEAKALHMEGKGKPEGSAVRGAGLADPPGKGAEKAADKDIKGAEKAEDKEIKGAEKAAEKSAKPATGPEGTPGASPGGKRDEAKGGQGKGN